MAASLFVRNRRKIGGIQLDAVINEQYTNRSTVTKFPIEDGSNINDHKIDENKTYVMAGVVSDTQLGISQIGSIIDSVTGLFGTSNASNLTRSQAAYQDLLALKDSGELLSIQTGLGVMENMVILDVNVTQNPKTSKSLFFTCPMEQLRIVQSEVAVIPQEILEGNTRLQATSPAESGILQEEPIQESNSSLLLQITESLVGPL